MVLSAAFILTAMTGLFKLFDRPVPYSHKSEYFYILIANFYTTFLVVAIKFIREKVRSDRRNALLEKEKTENELRFLKSQMNPHFLFNAINSIYVLIKKDPDFAGLTLVKFADMLRYQLYDSSREHVLLTADIRFLTDFLNLEKIRRDNFDFIVSKEGEIDNIQIPPHLFITFIENAVKHNVDPEMGSYVYAWFNVYGDELRFKCVNSKPQQTIGKNGAGGLGLANARRTLELLYPDRHRLEIQDEATIYSVNLTIQL